MVGNNAWMQNIKEWIEQNHPNLVTTGYQITSSDTTDYNCIAWRADAAHLLCLAENEGKLKHPGVKGRSTKRLQLGNV
ncbi:MAG: hypothetical protein QQW96_21190 [Tychonema bourrellyi B0820]|uniref:Uncharacterized protein n=1 Tax=Tychonema bourrellyi FEM_GT703 TaxID=2040638 RepID=A0A2G4F119_9CYAN|nr:hypothetical protein [Tychonema bourrellyi]MDQ2100152.1 hypothetical protein [Tychonema bourrellyi B0820]PHX55446.1 hypothetical protein CP500_010720 [Tychonema bourrellyi FEM_GT703]